LDRERIIVLKKTVYRDADLIIRGLNSHGAKLSFIAPGALKSRRRFGGGVLEVTNYIEVVYQESNKSALPRLIEAQILKEFQGLRRSYDFIQIGLTLLELVDRVSADGIQHGEDLFNLLGHGLQCLTQINESSLILFRLQFLLKFLFQQGVLEKEPWMDLFLRVQLRDHSTLVKTLEQEGLWSEYSFENKTRIENDMSKETGVLSNEQRNFSTLLLDRLAMIESRVKAYKETGAMA